APPRPATPRPSTAARSSFPEVCRFRGNTVGSRDTTGPSTGESMPAAPPSRQEDGPSALRARSRMSAGAGALAAAAAVLVFALHGTHPVFPPGLLPPLAGDGGTIAEETGAATRFLTTGSGPARQF